MSFNKAKAMRNAERYLTQGKIQAAISEYRQIVDQDPKDINTQNMLGDLYTKAGNESEAVKCYKFVAEYYNGQGFAKKAIAIYNKIHRIEPNSLEVSSKLADLYRTRGSYAEAKKHYESLAGHYEGKGQRVEALAMWESIAELDPRNAEIYLKIAESYWHDGRESEASESFIKAGVRLADCGNHESAVTAFSRALEITPLDFEAIEGLVRSQITLGYPEEAAKALEIRIANDPYDKGTNALLVDCFYDMGDAASAENVIVKMVERDPSNYRQFFELIDVYFKNDDLDSAVRVMSMIAEHMLVSGEHNELLVLIEEVLARNPEHIGALRLLARYHAWLKDEGELKAALERVAESARIVGSEEDELYALSQLAILAPHDTAVSSRLDVLGRGARDFDSASHFHVKQTGEVPSFESYEVLSKIDDRPATDTRNAENGNKANPESSDESGFELERFDSGDAVSDRQDTLEAEVVSEQHEGPETGHRGSVSSETSQDTVEQPNADAHDQFQAQESGNLTSPENGDDTVADGYDPTTLSAVDERKLEEEMESIRFYLEQGYNGLADKSLCELEIEFGLRPEIIELREALTNSESGQSGSSGAGSAAQTGGAITVEKTESTHHEEITAGVSQDEAVFDESQITSNSEAQQNQEVAEPVQGDKLEQDSNEKVALSGFESIGNETESESTAPAEIGLETEGASPENQSEADSETENDLTNSFESLRDELGLSESEDDANEDYENHYHHAVAYKEMGLTEEAIREFQQAVNSVSPTDGTKRFLNCCTLLGLCFMEKEMPNLGVSWFQKALKSGNLSAEEVSGIRYELASAFEADGEFEAAMEEFEKIYSVDVDFRDVGARIEQLTPKIPVSA